MDYAKLPIFQLMKAKLDYAAERQTVLAQNVANVDTPGYRAKDVQAPDFKAMLAKSAKPSIGMAITNEHHIGTGKPSASAYKTIERESTYEQSPVDNNVVVEEEMMRVAEAQSEYQRTLTLYRKTISMFKAALGNPNAG